MVLALYSLESSNELVNFDEPVGSLICERFEIFGNQITVMEIKSLKSKEKELLETVLAKTHWNIEKASRLLKISVSQIRKKIRTYDIKKTQTL